MKLTLCLFMGLFLAFVTGEVFTVLFDFETAVILMTITGSVIAISSVGIGLEWEKNSSDWFD